MTRRPRFISTEFFSEYPIASEIAPGRSFAHREVLSETDRHHLLTVLRQSVGGQVELLNPARAILTLSEIKEIGEESIVFNSSQLEVQAHEGPSVNLLVGTPKGSAAELIVEKLTELDVNRIIFFDAGRTQSAKKIEWEKRLARLTRIATEAAKQCERLSQPEVLHISALTDAIKNARASEMWLLTPPREELSQVAEISPLQDLVAQRNHARSLGKISSTTISERAQFELEQNIQVADFTIVVGPEGGLTKDEMRLAISLGCRPVSLGSNILRVETAVIASAAIATLLS